MLNTKGQDFERIIGVFFFARECSFLIIISPSTSPQRKLASCEHPLSALETSSFIFFSVLTSPKKEIPINGRDLLLWILMLLEFPNNDSCLLSPISKLAENCPEDSIDWLLTLLLQQNGQDLLLSTENISCFSWSLCFKLSKYSLFKSKTKFSKLAEVDAFRIVLNSADSFSCFWLCSGLGSYCKHVGRDMLRWCNILR